MFSDAHKHRGNIKLLLQNNGGEENDSKEGK